MAEHQTSFLSLPGEIRNNIYSLALISEQPFRAVVVDEVPPLKYRALKAQGFFQNRTTYQTPEPDTPCLCPGSDSKSDAHSPQQEGETTYTLGTATDKPAIGLLTIGLLGVNRLIRHEASVMFYNDNVFFFKSMGAVIPFLKDREHHVPYLKRFLLTLQIDCHGHDGARHQAWLETFRLLASFPALRICQLILDIYCDCNCTAWENPETRGKKLMDWVYSVIQLRNLDRLEILWSTDTEIYRHCRDWCEMLYWVCSLTAKPNLQGLTTYFQPPAWARHCGPNRGSYSRDPKVSAFNAMRLWCYLAPKMLRNRKWAIERAAHLHNHCTREFLKPQSGRRDHSPVGWEHDVGVEVLFLLEGVRGGEVRFGPDGKTVKYFRMRARSDRAGTETTGSERGRALRR
ncbi:hypothetical protein MMC28_003440 [Mycoblastus sanguinarius]|nr:hypothetical protein [Mycoblastus sanguinarius]